MEAQIGRVQRAGMDGRALPGVGDCDGMRRRMVNTCTAKNLKDLSVGIHSAKLERQCLLAIPAPIMTYDRPISQMHC